MSRILPAMDWLKPDAAVARWLAAAAALAASILCLICISAQSKFQEVPIGCDDFGYYRQAQLFRDKGLIGGLDTAITDETSMALVAVAKSNITPMGAWLEAVAPHCHHYKPATGRIILQYPPGTGFLLAAFPEGTRGRWLAHSATLIMLAALLAILAINPSPITAAGVTWLAWVLFYDKTWVGGSWSIHPSMLCALALAAMLAWRLDFTDLTTRWRWHALAGFVLGLSITFRIPNGFMLAGFAAAYGIAFLGRPSARALTAPVAFGFGAMIGVLPVLVANTINAGAPWSTTYGAVDAASPLLSWQALSDGLHFYLVTYRKSGVFVGLSLVTVIALGIALLRKADRNATYAFAIVAVNLVSNLAYFLLHDPRAPYYPVPMATFTAAATTFTLMRLFAGLATAPPLLKGALVLMFAGVVSGMALRPHPLSPLQTDPNQHPAYDARTIVWADMSTGYFHYFLHRQASKLAATDPHAREQLVKTVRDAGFSQVLIADTAAMRDAIERLKPAAPVTSLGKVYEYDAFIIKPGAPAAGQQPLPR